MMKNMTGLNQHEVNKMWYINLLRSIGYFILNKLLKALESYVDKNEDGEITLTEIKQAIKEIKAFIGKYKTEGLKN